MPGGVADGDGAHHLPVAQRVDLPGVPRDAGAGQGVVGKGDRLHLPVGADVERVGSAKRGGTHGGQPREMGVLKRSTASPGASPNWGSPALDRGPPRGETPHPTPQKTLRCLRLSSRDGCQAGGQAGGSHGWVRIKADLQGGNVVRGARAGHGARQPPKPQPRGSPFAHNCSIADGDFTPHATRKGKDWGDNQRFQALQEQRGTRSPSPHRSQVPSGKLRPSAAETPNSAAMAVL